MFTLMFFVHLQSDKEVKAFFYIDAVMFFARCGKAIEVSSSSVFSIPLCGQFNIEQENIHREEHQQRASVLVAISTEMN